MGVFKNKELKRKELNVSVKNRNHRTKGDRLGWVSIDKVQSVNIEYALSSSRVVSKESNFTPLLVP